MILIDANVLLYAYDSSSSHHAGARKWFEAALSKPEQVGFAWMTLLAFLRISTSPRALHHPLSIAEAETIVTGWLERPMVTLVSPSERHWGIFCELMTRGQTHGPLIMDAHLAALAIEHGATLATTDRDFTRFPGLKFFDPVHKG